MKKEYIKPETSVDEFKTVDVISTSVGNDIQDDDNVVEWEW